MTSEIRSFLRTARRTLGRPLSYLEKKSYIFVISHMRSYSSLLCHILGSHKEISGYAEMQQPYSWWMDFLILKRKVSVATENNPNGRYLLDKLLHSEYAVSEEILNQRHVRLIFILRKPEKSIKSIINMGRRPGKDSHKFGNAAWVLDYYLERLMRMQDYAKKSKRKLFFVQAERIIEDADSLLHCLSVWLELRSSLTPQYYIFKRTGAPGYGDPSLLIRKGELVKTVSDYGHIHIPPEMLTIAENAYEACRDVLLQCADSA